MAEKIKYDHTNREFSVQCSNCKYFPNDFKGASSKNTTLKDLILSVTFPHHKNLDHIFNDIKVQKPLKNGKSD